MPGLAAAGFQVIVPDLRGYGRSGQPEAVQAYSLPLLGGDVRAVLADLKIARAHVVGHDWGAALAWLRTTLAPGSVDHLIALSVGHPATFRRTLQQRAVPVPRDRRTLAQSRTTGPTSEAGPGIPIPTR